MEKLLIDHLYKIAPANVTVKVEPHHGGDPYMTPVDSNEYLAAAKAIEATFGKAPIPVRGGGSIPITALFESELGCKVVFLVLVWTATTCIAQMRNTTSSISIKALKPFLISTSFMQR